MRISENQNIGLKALTCSQNLFGPCLWEMLVKETERAGLKMFEQSSFGHQMKGGAELTSSMLILE